MYMYSRTGCRKADRQSHVSTGTGKESVPKRRLTWVYLWAWFQKTAYFKFAYKVCSTNSLCVCVSGSTVYTCMLNKRGGTESDLTVSRLEPGAANLPLAPESNGEKPRVCFDFRFTCHTVMFYVLLDVPVILLSLVLTLLFLCSAVFIVCLLFFLCFINTVQSNIANLFLKIRSVVAFSIYFTFYLFYTFIPSPFKKFAAQELR